MSEYHVSCGMFGIYAGTVKKNGTEWKDKTCVTDEAIKAVREQSYKLVCLNDNQHIRNFDNMLKELKAAFNHILPEKSTFEL